MLTNAIQEGPLTENFVSPIFCKHLFEAGMTKQVPYCWRQYADTTVLSTDFFDPDCYYKDALPYLHVFTAPIVVIPAYTIKDIEKILPCGYLLQLNENCQYELMLGNQYEIQPVTGIRMPDTYAAMALLIIKKRLVNVEKVNLIIERK